MIHVNINGLLNKIEKLKFYNQNQKFDILCITETHITHEVLETEYQLEHYTCINSPSNSKHTAGVLVYIKNTCDFEIINNLYFPSNNINIIMLKVEIDQQYITLIVVYRSPSSPINDFIPLMEKYLQDLQTNKYLNVILIGDINIDYLSNKSSNNKWKLLLDNYNMKQINNQYTHKIFTGQRMKKTIIDHVIVDKHQQHIFKCKNEYNMVISDHVPQIVFIQPKYYT